MKFKLIQPNIPKPENGSIALHIDIRRRKEHILIGDFDALNRYLRGEKKENIFYEEMRPIGSFLLDIVPRAEEFADIRVDLCDNLSKNGQPDITKIESLYTESNPTIKFTTLILWQEYMRGMERLLRKENNDDFIDRIEEITLPFRYNLMNEVLEWQKLSPYNPLCDMPYEYFKYPVQAILIPDSKGTKEYAVSDNTILPLVLYYLKIIYEKHKYFSYCKVCGKLFLAPDANKTVICSEKCRKKQQQLNKKKYDDATRDVDFERTFRNEKMYWYNRITKAKNLTDDEKILSNLQKAYDEFKRVSKIKKKQVKTGLLSFIAFDTWYLDQRDIIDNLMLKYGLSK